MKDLIYLPTPVELSKDTFHTFDFTKEEVEELGQRFGDIAAKFETSALPQIALIYCIVVKAVKMCYSFDVLRIAQHGFPIYSAMQEALGLKSITQLKEKLSEVSVDSSYLVTAFVIMQGYALNPPKKGIIVSEK